MKLPDSLTTLAASGASPKSCTRCPSSSRIGRARAFAAEEPDRQIHSVRAAAASGRPKTGAATNRLPRRACSAASLREVSGDTVLIEMCKPPSPSASAKPPAPSTASSSTESLDNRLMTTPPARTAPAGDSATAAPSAAKGSALSRDRLNTVTVKPLARRLQAMGEPILPRPITATASAFMCISRSGSRSNSTPWIVKPKKSYSDLFSTTGPRSRNSPLRRRRPRHRAADAPAAPAGRSTTRHRYAHRPAPTGAG